MSKQRKHIVKLIPVRAEKLVKPKRGPACRATIGHIICLFIRKSRIRIQRNDIIVISSKLVSYLQGRIYPLKNVRVPEKLEKKTSSIVKLSEIIHRETSKILGEGIIVLALKKEGLVANAGIDLSNTRKGTAVLPVFEPFRTANEIRWTLEGCFRKSIGVIIADSRITPMRKGTIGVAVAYSGITGVKDKRGEKDALGNKLRHTLQAIADNIASSAQLLMGEADELTPIVIFRGLSKYLDKRNHPPEEPRLTTSECLYARNWGELKAVDDETDLLATINGRTHLS